MVPKMESKKRSKTLLFVPEAADEQLFFLRPKDGDEKEKRKIIMRFLYYGETGDVRRHAYFLSLKREFQNSVSGISTYFDTKHIIFLNFSQASAKWILRKTAILSRRS